LDEAPRGQLKRHQYLVLLQMKAEEQDRLPHNFAAYEQKQRLHRLTNACHGAPLFEGEIEGLSEHSETEVNCGFPASKSATLDGGASVKGNMQQGSLPLFFPFSGLRRSWAVFFKVIALVVVTQSR
jgi:hypothetical protein